MESLKRFAQGFFFLFKGLLLLLAMPQLRRWTYLPFIINFILFVLGIGLGLVYLPSMVTSAMALISTDPTSPLITAAYYLAFALIWISFVILWTYVFFLVAGAVASPFNSVLAERALISLGLLSENASQTKGWLGTFFRSIPTAAAKLLFSLLLGALILLMSFIPVLFFCSSFLALLILAIDILDHSFEIYEMKFYERVRFVRTIFPELLGMTAALALTLVVPGLIILIMPIAVVGGAAVLKSLPSAIRSPLDSRYHSP